MPDKQQKRLMLMFTIGPVQSFIEAARKTEDLWMGSYILSYLVAHAMDKVRGGDVALIYPAIGNQSPFDFWLQQDCTTPSFPNLFLAIGNGIEVSQDELAARANEAANRVNVEYKRMAECVLDKAFYSWRGTYVEELLNRQVSDFFDVYWVITPETKQNYGDWYAQTAGSLAASKNCRTFAQVSELGRKCSLDGTREILHLHQDEPVREAMRWWQTFVEREPKYCRQGEALCAVSLTKRMGRYFLQTQSKFKNKFSHNSLHFPSTSEVATADFKRQLQRNLRALAVYGQFLTAVKKLKAANNRTNNREADIPIVKPLPKIGDLPGNIDGEWLYEETWSESYLKRYYNIDAQKERAQIDICKGLRRQLVQHIGEPGRYYAVIALDADNMGEKNRKAHTQTEHEKHSRQLLQYTQEAREIIERKYLGKLTYAGGDDLLALANLTDLLPMVKELREKFPDFTTASAGVCIAHNRVPLGDVLQRARSMEHAAKHEGDRDALGIALFKHSGNISQTVTKWQHNDLHVLAISERLMKLLRDDEISKRFLYTFRETVAKFINDDGDIIQGVPSDLIAEEFTRLIKRAYKTQGKQLDEANQQTISQTIALWPLIKPFTNFLGFLEIINFIARRSQ